jgi:hypothetical protein
MLTRLRESVRRKRPRLWPVKRILHHDNASAHDALRFREFLTKNSITKMDQPPYSPDLAPCDFWLSKIKKCPKGTKICWPFWHPMPRKNVTARIPENDFQDRFRQWHHRITKCMASRGEYFEGHSGTQVSKFCFHSAIPELNCRTM